MYHFVMFLNRVCKSKQQKYFQAIYNCDKMLLNASIIYKNLEIFIKTDR